MKSKFVLFAIGLSFRCVAQGSQATMNAQLYSLKTQAPLNFNNNVGSAAYLCGKASAQNQEVLATYSAFDRDLTQVLEENNVPVELRFATILLSGVEYLSSDLYDCEVLEILKWNNLDGDNIDINQKLVIKVDSAKKVYYQKIDRMNKEERKAIQRKD